MQRARLRHALVIEGKPADREHSGAMRDFEQLRRRTSLYAFWNYYQDRLVADVAAEFVTGRLLDVGCGEKPYRSVLSPYVSDHVGVEHPETPLPSTEVDVFAEAQAMPFGDGEFDTAIAMSMLEHVVDDRAVLQEISRVLKPGSAVVATIPFLMFVHLEPWDYRRYTQFGIRQLFVDAGFDVMRVEPLGGFWSMLATMVLYYLKRLQDKLFRWQNGPVSWLCGVTYPLWIWLDKADPKASRYFSLGYLIVARKPGGSSGQA